MKENCSVCSIRTICRLFGNRPICDDCSVEMDIDEQEFLDYLKYGDGGMLSIEIYEPLPHI